jgi:hypothetical protein
MMYPLWRGRSEAEVGRGREAETSPEAEAVVGRGCDFSRG